MLVTRRRGKREARTLVIHHVVAVLRCFTADDPLQGVTEIASQVGLHKSSVSRILATLEEDQIVERDDASRKFRLGLGLIGIAGPLLADLDVRRIGLPILQSLTRDTRETSALVVWDGTQAVTVEQVPSSRPVKHMASLGTRYGTARDASVQVFLAHLAAPDLDAWVGRAGGHDEVDVDHLRAELTGVGRRGCAVNRGATSAEEVGVCAPVRDHRDEVVAGVLIAAPSYRVDDAVAEDLVDRTRAAALEISQRLGSSFVDSDSGGDL